MLNPRHGLKYFLSLLLFCGVRAFGQNHPVPLQYRLGIDTNKIHVELKYLPQEPDSTVFSYGEPAFGGQSDILKGLQHLIVEAPARLRLDSAKRRIVVYFKNNDPIRINYEIVDTRPGNTTRNQLFRPMIMPDYVFIHGVNLFLTPQFRKDDPSAHVSVQWEKSPPFPVFYTFDPENDGSRTSITTVDSISFRFITGAKDLYVKRFHSESGANYLVLRSANIKPVTQSQIEKFYLGYNNQMRRYWKDTRIIKYSLVLQPFLGVDHNMSGVSFGNGFIGKYNEPDSIASGYRQFVISHEMGHYYLGDVVAFAGANVEGQWFDEGFNDYTTFFNLVSAGYMTAADFESEFNWVFHQLYSSQIKNTPNDKIFENFWKLGDYQKLPYWRGCVFAFFLDNQIALATKQLHSIRDVMLALKQLVSSRDKKMFTNEEFIDAVAKYLPRQQVEEAFKKYIIAGNSIVFDSAVLMPSLQVENKDRALVIHVVDEQRFQQHFKFD